MCASWYEERAPKIGGRIHTPSSVRSYSLRDQRTGADGQPLTVCPPVDSLAFYRGVFYGMVVAVPLDIALGLLCWWLA